MESTGRVPRYGYGGTGSKEGGGDTKKGLSHFIGIAVVTEYGCDTLPLFSAGELEMRYHKE